MECGHIVSYVKHRDHRATHDPPECHQELIYNGYPPKERADYAILYEDCESVKGFYDYDDQSCPRCRPRSISAGSDGRHCSDEALYVPEDVIDQRSKAWLAEMAIVDRAIAAYADEKPLRMKARRLAWLMALDSWHIAEVVGDEEDQLRIMIYDPTGRNCESTRPANAAALFQLDADDTCSLCLSIIARIMNPGPNDTWSEPTSLQIPLCTHIFHIECMRNWLKEPPNLAVSFCPLCRRQFPKLVVTLLEFYVRTHRFVPPPDQKQSWATYVLG